MDNQEAKTLLKDIAHGDKNALETFLRKISGRVQSIAVRILKDSMLSDDVMAEIMLKVWNNADKLSRLDNPVGYINVMSFNYAVDIKRRQREMPLFDNVFFSFPDTDVKLDIQRILEIMPEDQRTVLLLKINGGYNFREIGNILHMTNKAVRIRYENAVKIFKKYF